MERLNRWCKKTYWSTSDSGRNEISVVNDMHLMGVHFLYQGGMFEEEGSFATDFETVNRTSEN